VISEVVAEQVGRDGALNVAEVRAVSAALLAGGVVTTAHFMASAMLLLLENPDQLAKVRVEPTLIPRCTEEALRLEAPTQWTPRRAVQDVELAGVSIPAGAFVLLLQGACNRDPAVFDEPDRFDVTRPNATDHLSFGYGPHFCLGAPLARLEVRVAFEQLLARLDNLRLASGNELTHNPSPQFRGLRRLELEFGQ
jgi:cholest-4-en-3-one 26-monooxygenase